MAHTPAERREQGQQRRKVMPRVDHAAWNATLRREDPIRLMQASMRGRVSKLVALKYERMAASPFGFFRGAVPVMAYDLSLMKTPGIAAQLCGDAHVRNLGAYAGPDGRLVFDINDFDETIAGPFEWDVKRMAASLIVAARGSHMREMDCREASQVFLRQYRVTMLALSRLPVLEMARYQVHRLRSVTTVDGILRLAQRATPAHTLEQLTEVRQGVASKAKSGKAGPGKAKRSQHEQRVFKALPPVLTRVTGAMAKKVIASLEQYAKTLQPERRVFLAQYRPLDVAFKVVGTGSVGLRDYCVYMEGNGAKDPLFLQIKEEAESGYASYAGKVTGLRAVPKGEHQGRRVVDGERAMQLQSDPMLGWTTLDGREYLVRQLNDHKASINLDDLTPDGLMEYAEVCGELLARGHARSGGCMEIAGYLGRSTRFDDAVAAFATAYADQTEADWETLVTWRKSHGKAVTKKSNLAAHLH
ncbi:MAG: DUF2252 domain-containing protein [Acidobacteria bacterium]|nr:DUF2252 domain-containing protein [Acidobacteriota bacterium]